MAVSSWRTGGVCATCGNLVPGDGHTEACTGLVPGSEYATSTRKTTAEQMAEFREAWLALIESLLPVFDPVLRFLNRVAFKLGYNESEGGDR